MYVFLSFVAHRHAALGRALSLRALQQALICSRWRHTHINTARNIMYSLVSIILCTHLISVRRASVCSIHIQHIVCIMFLSNAADNRAHNVWHVKFAQQPCSGSCSDCVARARASSRQTMKYNTSHKCITNVLQVLRHSLCNYITAHDTHVQCSTNGTCCMR